MLCLWLRLSKLVAIIFIAKNNILRRKCPRDAINVTHKDLSVLWLVPFRLLLRWVPCANDPIIFWRAKESGTPFLAIHTVACWRNKRNALSSVSMTHGCNVDAEYLPRRVLGEQWCFNNSLRFSCGTLAFSVARTNPENMHFWYFKSWRVYE